MGYQEENVLSDQIQKLENLLNQLSKLGSLPEKLAFLNVYPPVIEEVAKRPSLKKLIPQQSLSNQYVLTLVLAIGQGATVFQGIDSVENPAELLDLLSQKMSDLEMFYNSLGGTVGYQLKVFNLLISKENEGQFNTNYERPEGIDVSQDTAESRLAVRWGVEALSHLASIYPVGGAGDRLNLLAQETGEPLPAAEMFFCGFTLLEWLIRDLQGWEFLHYKLFGRQLTTPIAMMTSQEKDNHQRILNLCEKAGWFGRSKESFRFFLQPMVPMITSDGEWAMNGPLQPMFKPGGHGVLWKSALDNGVFEWFESQQRKRVIVRQINNPVAGTDNGLLALAGVGCHNRKNFGFASCSRLLKTPEGMNVFKETKLADGEYEYCITNVEYTDFTRHGIEDVPLEIGGLYSQFPSNTNILFGDLDAIRKAVDICPLPGILVNMKNRVVCWNGEEKVEKLAGRLESTMQNIADYITDRSSNRLNPSECDLRTFLTYNKRCKTISVVKKAYVPGESLNGSPEGCFFELTENYRDLLANHCGVSLPPVQQEDDYLTYGPNFTALFHPAVGGLYSVISQKIRGGKIGEGAEFVVEASEIDIAKLDLDGSLLIEADAVMGKKDNAGIIVYDCESCGKCTLLNVKVRNQGRGHKTWRGVSDKDGGESLHIIIHGNGEFFAENIEFTGNLYFEVPDGYRLVVYEQGEEIAWHCEKIQKASWKWDYTFDNEDHVCLEKINIPRN